MQEKNEAKNFVRLLRDATGLNQADFGHAIGVHPATVQNWEGLRLPKSMKPNVHRNLMDLAVSHHLSEGIAALSGFPIKRTDVAGEPITAIPHGDPNKPRIRHQSWHNLLDLILDSGMPDAVGAVQSNLTVFANYVKSKTPTVPALRKKG